MKVFMTTLAASVAATSLAGTALAQSGGSGSGVNLSAGMNTGGGSVEFESGASNPGPDGPDGPDRGARDAATTGDGLDPLPEPGVITSIGELPPEPDVTTDMEPGVAAGDGLDQVADPGIITSIGELPADPDPDGGADGLNGDIGPGDRDGLTGNGPVADPGVITSIGELPPDPAGGDDGFSRTEIDGGAVAGPSVVFVPADSGLPTEDGLSTLDGAPGDQVIVDPARPLIIVPERPGAEDGVRLGHGVGGDVEPRTSRPGAGLE